MTKGKGQQVMQLSSFSLEFQLPDAKDIVQIAQRCYQLKIQSFCKYLLQYNVISATIYIMSGYILHSHPFSESLVCNITILDFNRLCKVEV